MGDGSDSGDASDGNLGIPLAPGRARLRDRQTQTHTGEPADFRPKPRNASWDGKGGRRGRGRGVRGRAGLTTRVALREFCWGHEELATIKWSKGPTWSGVPPPGLRKKILRWPPTDWAGWEVVSPLTPTPTAYHSCSRMRWRPAPALSPLPLLALNPGALESSA